MSGKPSRIVLAVLSGYVANAALIAITDHLLVRFARRDVFLEIDFITQCLYEVAAGYLCCVIAKGAARKANTILVVLGLLVGAISLYSSWRTEPHLYGIGLLVVWAPFVWIGYALWGLRTTLRAGVATDR